MKTTLSSYDGNFNLLINNNNNYLSLEITHSSLAEKYNVKVYLVDISSTGNKKNYDSKVWISVKTSFDGTIGVANQYTNICSEAVEFAKKVQDFIETQWNIN